MCEERERILERGTGKSDPPLYFVCSRCRKGVTVKGGETYYSTEESKLIVCLECKEKEEKEMCETLISEATSIVKDREVVYGSPKVNFEQIAKLWSSYLGTTVYIHDVGAMMILLKLTRLQKTPNHLDSLIDIAGYAECLRQIGEEE